MGEVAIADGSTSFSGGVNSLKPTTVASEINPDGLYRNQLAWLKNATVRGGGITCRNGWQYLCTVANGSELYQGGSMYEPLGANPYLVLSIGGRILRVRVDTDNSIDQINSGTTLNPASETMSHFLQAEQFLIIQAGDDVTLPLFWDGTIMRRSFGEGLVYMGYIDEDSITIPPIDGSTSITVTMNQPYAGAIGDTIVLKFEGKFRVTNIVGNDITIITLNSPYVNTTVFRGVFDAFGVYQRLSNPELPAATAMDYYMGRIWYARGRTYSAGDIVKGPSGTLPYNFFDSILKVTENPLAVGGDGFTVPGEAGNIRALAHTTELNTQLGQGKLYIFTRRAIYRLAVPVSRDDWIAADDATQPLQTVAQLRFGSVGDRCVVQVNEDLFYQTMEPAIRSLALSIRNDAQWGNTPLSRNEDRLLRFNDRERLRFASGILFDNRLWQTALPKENQVGTAFQAVAPLDFDLISTLETKLPPAWEGMYEGLDILQLFEADFGGRQRAFAAVFSRTTSEIQVWELTDHLKTDVNVNGESRVTWVSEYPSYNWNQAWLLKKMVGGELWVDRVYGEVIFKIEYRPDGDSCWYFWHTFKICSARNSCEDVDNPICYPITPYAEGFRQTLSLPLPQNVCQSTSGRPINVGYQMQVKITVTGWCRIRGLLLYAEPVEKALYYSLICPSSEVIQPDDESFTDAETEAQLTGLVDPFVGPPYPTFGYALFISDNTQPRLTWTVPEVFIDAEMRLRYSPFVMFEATINNYSWPPWDAGTVYEANQRASVAGVHYVSLTDGNGNNPPATSPLNWAIDPTEFEVWQRGSDSVYVKIGDSTGVGAPYVVWDPGSMTFTINAQSPSNGPWQFYIAANAGIPTLAFSNIFEFDNSCVPLAPFNLFNVPSGPDSVDFQWNPGGGIQPELDWIIACGQTSGGPYNVFDASADKFGNGYSAAGLSAGTYYAIVCRRDSIMCVSNASNETTFSLP